MKTKRLIARIMCVLMLALLSASLLTVPAFADDVAAESKTYQLESQNKMLWYEFQGGRSFIFPEEKEYLLSEDIIWGEEVSYDFRGIGGKQFTASGGITMTIDDDGNFEITFNNPKSYLNGLEAEFESFAVTGQFKEKYGNGGYHGGWCYIDEDTGKQDVYFCDEANFSTDRCNLISGPTDFGSSMDLSKSSAYVQTWIADDGQVSIDIVLSIYDNGSYWANDDSYGSVQNNRHLFTVVDEKVGIISNNQSNNPSNNQTIDTPAKEEAGEDGGTTIPAIIILGTLGAAAALAGAANGEGEDDDKKKRSTFKMYINKDFGNSLKKGDKPQAVYARIVEVNPSGEEIDRVDLTQQIQVFSSDNSLNITDGGMSEGGYRCAMASVPDVETPEPEGKVSFFFEGEGGTFTQNVIFNIAVPGIKFFQNNLTLPAGILDEPEFLAFEVSGMGDKYTIDLAYSGGDYELDVSPPSTERRSSTRSGYPLKTATAKRSADRIMSVCGFWIAAPVRRCRAR